jgi:signal transduction histidine kinase
VVPRRACHWSAGLGLAIVRETARHYGGDAWASENPGGGALLSVRVPLETAQFRALRHDAA